jgi:hypothetical protein
VDPFALFMLGLVAALPLVVLALGCFSPGSGARQLDWRPTRSVALEVRNEIDDLDQMREAVNARRGVRGQDELTDEELHARVAEDRRIVRKPREGGA